MINIEDLKDMGYVDDQLDFWQYWEPQANPWDRTPQQMVKEFIATSGQNPDPTTYFDLIEEEFNELFEAMWNGYSEEEKLKELADLVYVCYGYAIACGYDLDKALAKVHDNNMGRMFQEDGTIKRREDGKVIKNPTYPKVDLSDCV